MNNDLVSVIVPVYNAEKFIRETIQTVLNQTYKEWELLLIDDCSKDNSKNIINEYERKDKRIHAIKLEKNSGAAIARNLGIENAKGKYIAFLDADDLWNKEKLEKQVKFMEENDYAFSFTGYEFADESGKGTGKVVHVPKSINYKGALKNTTISTCAVMLNVEEIGKEIIKMPNIRRGQDTATWWKILKSGYKAYGLDEPLFLYRRTNQTLSSNKLKALKRTWNLYRNVEKINLIKSCWYFLCYVINAIRRRI